MDAPMTDQEKRFILAEMIKTSQLDCRLIVDFFKQHHGQPDWMAMQVPHGRNLHQVIRAAEDMLGPLIHPSGFPSVRSPVGKRKSLPDLPDPGPTKRQALVSPLEPPAYDNSPGLNSYTASAPQIHPAYAARLSPNGLMSGGSSARPPSAVPVPGLNTGSKSGQSTGQILGPALAPAPGPAAGGPISSPVTLPSRRKRGRPSKIEMEARDRDMSVGTRSRTSGYAPIKAAPVAIQPAPSHRVESEGGALPDEKGLKKPKLLPRLKSEVEPRSVSGSPGLTLLAAPYSGPPGKTSSPITSSAPREVENQRDGQPRDTPCAATTRNDPPRRQ